MFKFLGDYFHISDKKHVWNKVKMTHLLWALCGVREQPLIIQHIQRRIVTVRPPPRGYP